jgi:hypothetical protein
MAAGQLSGTASAEEERPSTSLGTNGEGVTRRALLGAGVSLTFAQGAGAEEAPPPPFGWSPSPAKAGEEWEAALADFRTAEEGLRRVEAACAGYRLDEEAAVLPGHMAACEALSAAVRRVIGTGVPDWAAFAVKVELLFAHEVEPHSIDDEVIAAVREDLRRLAGGT